MSMAKCSIRGGMMNGEDDDSFFDAGSEASEEEGYAVELDPSHHHADVEHVDLTVNLVGPGAVSSSSSGGGGGGGGEQRGSSGATSKVAAAATTTTVAVDEPSGGGGEAVGSLDKVLFFLVLFCFFFSFKLREI